jgi:hypothetical protein
MSRIRLIHPDPAQARELASRLREAGYVVNHRPLDASWQVPLRRNPPDAVVIDLSRIPSMGRDVGVALRSSRSTRGIPIVFVGGDAEKLPGIKKLLPDATYTTWNRIRSALKRAIARPPAAPVTHDSALAGYSGTPLPKKLGIKQDAVVALLGAPEDFEKILGNLPDGVKLRRGARGRCDLAIWFPRNRRELEAKVKQMGAYTGDDGIWIAWPKQASGMNTDLTQTRVRKAGLAVGLVDFKICAIDETFSGLKFTRRKAKR